MSEPVFFGYVFIFFGIMVILYRIALSVIRDKIIGVITGYSTNKYYETKSASTPMFQNHLMVSYEYRQRHYTVEYKQKVPIKSYPIGKEVWLFISKNNPEKVMIVQNPSPFLIMATLFLLMGMLLIIFGDYLPT